MTVCSTGGRASPRRNGCGWRWWSKCWGLYRDRYFDLNVRHFHVKLQHEHQIELSHTWVKLALQGAGLVRRGRKRCRGRGSPSSPAYAVRTKRLNEQVRRNIDRFPADFMFRLNQGKSDRLRSQFATSKHGRGGRRYQPYVFTEHGALMLASVLNSEKAIQASIQIVRAFVRLRELLATHQKLARKLAEMEKKYNAEFKAIFEVIQQLTEPPEERERKPIGFTP
jgi:phage regulator Rha-like protein